VTPKLWLAIREHKNSDTATEHEWEATEKGLRETQLKWELRRIEKLSGAIASKLRIVEVEARSLTLRRNAPASTRDYRLMKSSRSTAENVYFANQERLA
jgi:hypothetical protein